MLFRHAVRFPFSFALDSAGSNIAARIAMIAITTSNSISVKPREPRVQLVSSGRACFIGQRLPPAVPAAYVKTAGLHAF